MGIERFENIEAWQLARELPGKVYGLTKKTKFARDFGLKDQIQARSTKERKPRTVNPEALNPEP